MEDDAGLRELLARGLREEGFIVDTARDAGGALLLAERGCDAVIIDVGLPDADGRDLCQALRVRGLDGPVLFLTARDQVGDRLAGFAAGGDDYLTKPFHFAELLARLRALLKRSGAPRAGAVADVRLDPASHALTTPTASVALTPTEFKLLAALVASPGTVLRRRELVRAGWSGGGMVHDNTLDQYIARLRRKLRDVQASGTIWTARGLGYRFE
ncbi:MAG: response regulator transcription factor [Sphaerisporangium sp.]|nr:response regulator transcription factor [Sphaerisporangium sp.]